MSSLKVDVLWSPNHDDKYVTFGTDLCLYKVEEVKDNVVPKGQGQGLKIADDIYATLQSTNSDNQYIKCVAWYPKLQPDHLLAVGLANGRVVLTSFGRGGTGDPNNLIGKEFIPKHPRQCNHLAWNPVDSHLLAEGLDKYRADHSILIWDVNAKPSDAGHMAHDRRSLSAVSEPLVRPYVELGPNETVFSLAWFHQEPKTLVTGMNQKFLKIFDLRDISRPQCVAYTKAVNGVRIDPHNEHRLASFVEGQVTIWDTRNFDKPVLTLPENRPVMKLAWSPARRDLLACLSRDSSIVKLYDIQNITVDELEPAVIQRTVQPYSQIAVSSFDWHPRQENRMLTVTPQGTVRDVRIFERIALNWSPDMYFTWAIGRQLVPVNSVKLCQESNEDISIKMKRRALRGYGLKVELLQNVSMVDEDQVRNLWAWLNYVKSFHQPQPSVPGKPRQAVKIPGVKQILQGDTSSSANNAPSLRSEAEFLQSQEIDGHKFRVQKRVYRSEERTRALQLCGWAFDRESSSSYLIDSLENDREFARAAAIAACTLKIGRAIEVLSRGATLEASQGGNPSLNVVAMALAGFSEDKNTLWREKCRTLSSKLLNPYLRALFAFLTAEGDNYDAILDEEHVEVVDRVAFACMYLSDVKLTEYIEMLTLQLTEKGQLDGMLLTGLTTEGLDLLAQYVDFTGDVQTTSLVLLQTFPNPDIAKDPRVVNWIESYRNLLDSWRLWHQRAEFDVLHKNCDNTTRPQNQVFVSCNYCGKSVAFSSISARNRHFMFAGATGHKSKITSCPSCRKPLPRCSLCLINMGTGAGSYKHKQTAVVDKAEEFRLTKFSDWFTWCQTCRHGGHADHITQWFREHSECPVTGCTCKCSSLDAMGSVSSEQSSSTSNRHTPLMPPAH